MCKLKTTLMLRPGYLLVILFLGMPALVQAQLDDPTRPPGNRLVLPGGKKAGKTVTRYRLSSVYISTTRRTAVINDHTVEAGESVAGAKVIAIHSSAVTLQKQGKVFTVKLLSQVVKKTHVQ